MVTENIAEGTQDDNTNAAGSGEEGNKGEGGSLLGGGEAAEGNPGEGAEGDKDPEGGKGGEAAPEEYEDFAAPEGVVYDESTLTDFKALAKESNLSQEAAQKLLDMANGRVQDANDATTQTVADIRQEWTSEIKGDSEFGGAKLTETLEGAKRVLRNFGGNDAEDLVSFFNETGFGDHPGLIRMLAKIDRATREDKHVDGGSTNDDTKSDADVIYGSN